MTMWINGSVVTFSYGLTVFAMSSCPHPEVWPWSPGWHQATAESIWGQTTSVVPLWSQSFTSTSVSGDSAQDTRITLQYCRYWPSVRLCNCFCCLQTSTNTHTHTLSGLPCSIHVCTRCRPDAFPRLCLQSGSQCWSEALLWVEAYSVRRPDSPLKSPSYFLYRYNLQIFSITFDMKIIHLDPCFKLNTENMQGFIFLLQPRRLSSPVCLFVWWRLNRIMQKLLDRFSGILAQGLGTGQARTH